jgi:hypothetical protein
MSLSQSNHVFGEGTCQQPGGGAPPPPPPSWDTTEADKPHKAATGKAKAKAKAKGKAKAAAQKQKAGRYMWVL